jgi:hypothetical protein
MPFKPIGDYGNRKNSAEERSEPYDGFEASEVLFLAKNFCMENAECI